LGNRGEGVAPAKAGVSRSACAAQQPQVSVALWRSFIQVIGAFCLLLPARAEEPLLNAGATAPPAVVVTVHDAQATEAFRARPEIVRAMVDRGITNLTGKATVAEAWRSLVCTQDTADLTKEIIGLKVYSVPGPNSGTRPAVVAAIVEGLLAAGVPPKHVIVWDRQLWQLRLAGYSELADHYGIRLAGSAQEGYDEKAAPYENPILGKLIWGDLEFGRQGENTGRNSYFSKLLTQEITRIINVSPMLNHDLAGVSGNLYSLAIGSVDNVVRFEADGDRLARAVPEIYAQSLLSDRVALNVTDALICQYEGGERGLLHYSKALNELRFSKDPVALDCLSVKELGELRTASGAPSLKPSLDLYANAALLQLGVNDLKHIRVEKLE
jgi:hypothetical protein